MVFERNAVNLLQLWEDPIDVGLTAHSLVVVELITEATFGSHLENGVRSGRLPGPNDNFVALSLGANGLVHNEAC